MAKKGTVKQETATSKRSEAGVKSQIAYREQLIARLVAAGRTDQAAHQRALHAKRVELSKGVEGMAAYWIPERVLLTRFPKLAAKTATADAPKPAAVAAKATKSTAKVASKPVASPPAVAQSASK
jgi:hypothetical protein